MKMKKTFVVVAGLRGCQKRAMRKKRTRMMLSNCSELSHLPRLHWYNLLNGYCWKEVGNLSMGGGEGLGFDQDALFVDL